MPNTRLDSLVWNKQSSVRRLEHEGVEWQTDSGGTKESLTKPVSYRFLDEHPLTRGFDYKPFTRHPFLDGDKQIIAITNQVYSLPDALKDKQEERDAYVSDYLNEDYLNMLVDKTEEVIHAKTTPEIKHNIFANKVDTLVRMLHPTLVLEELAVEKIARSFDDRHKRMLATRPEYKEILATKDRLGLSLAEYQLQFIEEMEEAEIDPKEIARFKEFGFEAMFPSDGDVLRDAFQADLASRDSYQLMRKRAIVILFGGLSDEDKDVFLDAVDPDRESEADLMPSAEQLGVEPKAARAPRIGKFVNRKFVQLKLAA